MSNVSLPARVIVSLRAGFVLAIANIVCVAILAWAYLHVKADAHQISVTGSAKKLIQSDAIVWEAKIFVNEPELAKAYDALKAATDKTLAYLRENKIADRDTKLSAIYVKKNLARDEKGNTTDKVSSFELIQTIEIASADVLHVADVSRRVTALIKDGIMLESQPPRYLYTKLADLKIAMLAEATRDATSRAQQIAGNSQATLGPIREARMGVMQIYAVHSDEATGSGVNDTTSYEKEITAIVSARFELN